MLIQLDATFLVFVDHIEGDGERLFQLAADRDLEGIVAKHQQSRHTVEDGNTAWVKIRNRRYSQMIGRDELFERRYEAAGGRPTVTALRLRAITRAIENLGVMHTQEKNREHALKVSQALPALLVHEVRRHPRYLEHRIQQLRREARRLIAQDRSPLPAHAHCPWDWRHHRAAYLGRVSGAARQPRCSSVGSLQRT